MGLGDDIMLLGEAQKRARQANKKVWITSGNVPYIYTKQGVMLYKNNMAKNVDFISTTPENAIHYDTLSHGNPRPYIANKLKDSNGNMIGLRHQPYTPVPFALIQDKQEKKWIKDTLKEYKIPKKFIAINPDTKTKVFKGKDWGKHKWLELINRLHNDGLPLVRFAPNTEIIPNIVNIPTPTARHAFILGSKASLGVGWDGAFIHALTGYNIQCVSIHGHSSGPKSVGYAQNYNINYGDEIGCGIFSGCPECLKALECITVDVVYETVHKAWHNIT